MTMIEPGTGSSKSRRRKQKRAPSPEEMLANFRAQSASAAEVRELAHNHILANSEFEDEATRAFNMWSVDGWLALKVKDPKPEAERRATEAVREQITETLRQGFEQKVEAEATIRLLEYLTPYGKAIGDCTGAECQRLSRRFGSFFSELAKRITRGEMVRAHLSEAELQEIAKTHRLIGPRAMR